MPGIWNSTGSAFAGGLTGGLDPAWKVAYLIIDTSNWIGGKSVLVSPSAITTIDVEHQQIRVRLTRKEIESSPSVDTADIELIEDVARRLFFNREKPFATVLAEFDTMNGLHPHVKALVEFLRRRDVGKHGRYLEGLRAKKTPPAPPTAG